MERDQPIDITKKTTLQYVISDVLKEYKSTHCHTENSQKHTLRKVDGHINPNKGYISLQLSIEKWLMIACYHSILSVV